MLHAEWLRQLLEPALAATLDNNSAATAAASSALTALATLESLSPGSLQSMMLEVTAFWPAPSSTQNTLHTHCIQAASSNNSILNVQQQQLLASSVFLPVHLEIAGVQQYVAASLVGDTERRHYVE